MESEYKGMGSSNAGTGEVVSALNKLLRGEISSVETYDQVLEKIGAEPESVSLREIYSEHQNAVETLREQVIKNGGEPDEGSGPWGLFAQAVTGSAKIFGDKAALKALKEGEEHGIKEYEEALADQSVPPEAQSIISTSLLPNQRKHVMLIDKMMTQI